MLYKKTIKRKSITCVSDKLNSHEDDVQSAFHEGLVTLTHFTRYMAEVY